jgi:cytidylate kinase
MAIITISRGAYHRGKEISEQVAERLGYDCINRETILYASEQWDIPEIKLVRAIGDAPSILDRFSYRKEKYVAYIQAALVRLVHQDNIVYHGLAGHFLLRGVPHVCKVRIIADLGDRVREEMARATMSAKETMHLLTKDDEQRRKWSKYLYGIDTADAGLYDLTINIRDMTVDGAVDLICLAAGKEEFQTTHESQQALDDLLLACDVKVRLVDLKPDVEVTARDGLVYVSTEAHSSQEDRLVREISKIARSVPGVEDVRINVRWLASSVFG